MSYSTFDATIFLNYTISNRNRMIIVMRQYLHFYSIRRRLETAVVVVSPLWVNGVNDLFQIVREWRDKRHALLRPGMLNCQSPRVQQRTTNLMLSLQSIIPIGIPVHIISVNGSVSVLQVHSNLMRPSRFDPDLRQCQFAIVRQGINKGYRASALGYGCLWSGGGGP